MVKKNRIKVGQLVSSSDSLRRILSKRLIIQVKYYNQGFTHNIISENVIGISTTIY